MTPSIERFLMIGNEADLPLLRSLTTSFPANAQGNIFLELPDDRRPLLSAPPGISTSVLPRSLPSVLHAPGTRACVALESWVGEWVHGEHASAEGHAIFVGLAGNPLVERLCAALVQHRPGLHLHRACPGGGHLRGRGTGMRHAHGTDGPGAIGH